MWLFNQPYFSQIKMYLLLCFMGNYPYNQHTFKSFKTKGKLMGIYSPRFSVCPFMFWETVLLDFPNFKCRSSKSLIPT